MSSDVNSREELKNLAGFEMLSNAQGVDALQLCEFMAHLVKSAFEEVGFLLERARLCFTNSNRN